MRSWDDVHDVCASLGVVLRPHGNGLVFEDVEQGVRVKASFVGRELSVAGRAAPRRATPVRFDFESDESGNAAVGVAFQFGDPNAKQSSPQVDIAS